MVALQSEKRSLLELSEIADLTVKEQLQTISDVSSVSIWGEKKYSMRLWLDPIKMAGYGITPMDVKNAVDNENVELPSGSIEGNTIELNIRTMGLMSTAKMFDDLIIKHDGNQIIRFSDIGRAELGAADIQSYMKMNGVPMVGVVVVPQPGANHIDIADAVYQRMEQMKKDLPEDVHYSYGFDNTKFIRASIDEVKQTVYEAFALVIIIIFLFLRDWRVTLVPCIVIPVSLVGSFFIMYLFGFSINVLTMLAVVLAVGLDREHLYPYRARHESEEGRNRRRQGNLFCRHLHDGHTGGRVLSHRIYGRNDRTAFPGVQYGHFGSSGHFGLFGFDIHPYVGYQIIETTQEKEFLLPVHRTILYRNEQHIQSFIARRITPPCMGIALYRGHGRNYRISMGTNTV